VGGEGQLGRRGRSTRRTEESDRSIPLSPRVYLKQSTYATLLRLEKVAV